MVTRKKRIPAATVRHADPESEALVLPRTTAVDKDQEIAVVIPSVQALLQDARAIVGANLAAMKTLPPGMDDEGKRIRNLVSSIATIIDAEKKANEGLDDLSNLTPAQLVENLRKALARAEGRDTMDEEDDE